MNAFTLVMLGTGTVFVPEADAHGDYPRGELLSVMASCIQSNPQQEGGASPAVRGDESPLVSDAVEVVIGPGVLGREVSDRIARGILAVLNAIARQQFVINVAAHSRGAVESVLIAHGVQEILACLNKKELPEGSLVFTGQLLREIIFTLEKSGNSSSTRNTGNFYEKIGGLLKTFKLSLPDLPLACIEPDKVRLNLFLLDPVPGQATLISWADDRFGTIPAIVRRCVVYYYANERSSCFNPVYLNAEALEKTEVERLSIYGHHGTGSSGNGKDQQKYDVVGDTTHCQLLLFVRLYDFLKTNGVTFDESMFEREHPLIQAIKQALSADSARVLDTPWALRKLYHDMYSNAPSYYHFNRTRYPASSLQAERKFVCETPFAKKFPLVLGYVNEEHKAILHRYVKAQLTGEFETQEESGLPGAQLTRCTTFFVQAVQEEELQQSSADSMIGGQANPMIHLVANVDRHLDLMEIFRSVIIPPIQAYFELSRLGSTPENSENQARLRQTLMDFQRQLQALLPDDSAPAASSGEACAQRSPVKDSLAPVIDNIRTMGQSYLIESIHKALEVFKSEIQNLLVTKRGPGELVGTLQKIITDIRRFKAGCESLSGGGFFGTAINDCWTKSDEGAFIQAVYEQGEEVLARLKAIYEKSEAQTGRIAHLENEIVQAQAAYKALEERYQEAVKHYEIEQTKVMTEFEARAAAAQEEFNKQRQQVLEAQTAQAKEIVELKAQVAEALQACESLNRTHQQAIQTHQGVHQSQRELIAALERQASQAQEEYQRREEQHRQALEAQGQAHHETVAGLEARHRQVLDNLEQAHRLACETQKRELGERLNTIRPLYYSISSIERHADKLEARGCQDAVRTARALITGLNEQMERYRTDSSVTLDAFKINCTRLINEASPELEKHRGWKRILKNLALCVLTLGVGYLAIGAIHQMKTGQFLFFNETRSQQILAEAKKELEAVAPPNAPRS